MTTLSWDRVAVVGLGAVTAQGPTAEDLWQGARAGRVAIRPLQMHDTHGLRTKIGGEADESAATAWEYRRPAGFRERALDFALLATAEALRALPAGAIAPDRIGVVLGTCNAGLLSSRAWLVEPDPWLPPLVTPQALAEQVAAAFALAGPVLAINTACASGANAIGLGADLLRLGRADAVLAGGTDALSDVVLAGFNALESLAPTPAAPYSGNREGLSLGEGSGMVLLVRAETAASLGLTGVAEVLGYGLSADGFHATAPRPDGSGAARAIRAALRHAGVEATQVAYVNGHGTGTPKNDVAETRAIRAAYGEAADDLLVSSTKSVIGHLLGAAGAAEAIVTARALAERVAPPTAGFRERDPDCDLDYVADGPRPFTGDVAVSNNFAFAGANAALVLARPDAVPVPPVPDLDEVVVTGVSVLSPAGDGVAAARAAWLAGRGPGDGRIDLDVDPYLSRKDRRRMDRLGMVSVVAAAKALAAAGVQSRSPAAAAAGVVFGTGAGPMEAMERFTVPLLREGAVAADPAVFPNTVYNQAAGQVALHLGLYGPTSTLSAGHASGAAACAYALDLLTLGHAEMLVCVATDVLTESVAAAYAATGLRLPIVEGGVALVLERRGAALRRGAVVLGTLAGSGISSAATGALPRDRQGHATHRAMAAALAAAGVSPAEVGSVWLSATGLGMLDRAEARAVHRLFGDTPDVHAPKRVLGEPIGTGGALLAALALQHPGRPGPAVVNSSSIGGTEVSIVLRREGSA
jgi:3-oxoacyl-[acyl-carrier-protein] synthase II